ncbi:MAG: hypothetical protein JOS17DRAFT_591033 [Linnemannia elongata]|nr:MAG: hypothetical protein JOS17DRAFT_591033 [Linnemannia elongata]
MKKPPSLSSSRPQLFSFLRQPDVFHGVLVSKLVFSSLLCLFDFVFVFKTGRLVAHSSVFVRKEWYGWSNPQVKESLPRYDLEILRIPLFLSSIYPSSMNRSVAEVERIGTSNQGQQVNAGPIETQEGNGKKGREKQRRMKENNTGVIRSHLPQSCPPSSLPLLSIVSSLTH